MHVFHISVCVSIRVIIMIHNYEATDTTHRPYLRTTHGTLTQIILHVIKHNVWRYLQANAASDVRADNGVRPELINRGRWVRARIVSVTLRGRLRMRLHTLTVLDSYSYHCKHNSTLDYTSTDKVLSLGTYYLHYTSHRISLSCYTSSYKRMSKHIPTYLLLYSKRKQDHGLKSPYHTHS